MAAPASTSRPAGAAVASAARLPMAVVQWASARRSAPTITPHASPSEQQAVADVAAAAAAAFATGADLWGVDAVPSEAGWAGSRGWGAGTDPWTWRTFYKGLDGRLRLSGQGGGTKKPPYRRLGRHKWATAAAAASAPAAEEHPAWPWGTETSSWVARRADSVLVSTPPRSVGRVTGVVGGLPAGHPTPPRASAVGGRGGSASAHRVPAPASGASADDGGASGGGGEASASSVGCDDPLGEPPPPSSALPPHRHRRSWGGWRPPPLHAWTARRRGGGWSKRRAVEADRAVDAACRGAGHRRAGAPLWWQGGPPVAP